LISHNPRYSPRSADDLITQGLVKITNKIDLLRDDVKFAAKVFVTVKRVQQRTQFSVIICHKQKGDIVSKKVDRGIKTIYDTFP
ncbi:rRNA pseudouridine synthase, partial [Campylobacter jejuni]